MSEIAGNHENSFDLPPSTFFVPFHQQYHLTSDKATIVSTAGLTHRLGILTFIVRLRDGRRICRAGHGLDFDWSPSAALLDI